MCVVLVVVVKVYGDSLRLNEHAAEKHVYFVGKSEDAINPATPNFREHHVLFGGTCMCNAWWC